MSVEESGERSRPGHSKWSGRLGVNIGSAALNALRFNRNHTVALMHHRATPATPELVPRAEPSTVQPRSGWFRVILDYYDAAQSTPVPDILEA